MPSGGVGRCSFCWFVPLGLGLVPGRASGVTSLLVCMLWGHGLWFGWPCMALHVGLAVLFVALAFWPFGRCLFEVPGSCLVFWCAVWFHSPLVFILAEGGVLI